MDARISDGIYSNSSFVMLLDGDEAGEGIARKLIDRYGEVLAQKTLKLTAISKSCKDAEKLFSEADKKKIIVASGLKGSSKATFQRSVELLVASNRKVDLDDSTKKSFLSLSKKVDELLGQSV